MDKTQYGKKATLIFFFTVVIVSAITEYMICIHQVIWGYPILMWIPAVAAIISAMVTCRENGIVMIIQNLLSIIRCK